MKKTILFSFSIVALVSSAFSQGAINVTSVDFTTNPARFAGKMIQVKDLVVNLAPSSTPGVVSPMTVSSPSLVSVGSASPAPVSAPGVTRCNAPRGFRSLDVDFTNDPSFNTCFFISESQYKSLPVGQNTVKATLTFKGDSRLGYTITMYKLQ